MERVEPRDELVQDVVERLTAKRDSPRKDASFDTERKAGTSLRRVMTNRADGRCEQYIV